MVMHNGSGIVLARVRARRRVGRPDVPCDETPHSPANPGRQTAAVCTVPGMTVTITLTTAPALFVVAALIALAGRSRSSSRRQRTGPAEGVHPGASAGPPSLRFSRVSTRRRGSQRHARAGSSAPQGVDARGVRWEPSGAVGPGWAPGPDHLEPSLATAGPGDHPGERPGVWGRSPLAPCTGTAPDLLRRVESVVPHRGVIRGQGACQEGRRHGESPRDWHPEGPLHDGQPSPVPRTREAGQRRA